MKPDHQGRFLGQIHQQEEAGSCALIEEGLGGESAGEKIQKGSRTTFDSSQVQDTSQWCVLQLSQRGCSFSDMQIEVENGFMWTKLSTGIETAVEAADRGQAG